MKWYNYIILVMLLTVLQLTLDNAVLVAALLVTGVVAGFVLPKAAYTHRVVLAAALAAGLLAWVLIWQKNNSVHIISYNSLLSPGALVAFTAGVHLVTLYTCVVIPAGIVRLWNTKASSHKKHNIV